MKKPKLLYDRPVCRKCVYALANRRQGAWLIDALVIYFITFLCAVLFGLVMGMAGRTPDEVELSLTVLFYCITIPLFLLKDGFRGRSPGKALLGVRVIDERTGEPAGFLTSIKRNFIVLVPIPFLPLALAWQLTKGKRLGDDWAHSRVIWSRHAEHPVFRPVAALGEVFS
ncbi:MAG: RDD family protein [Planctomycetota bacterium]